MFDVEVPGREDMGSGRDGLQWAGTRPGQEGSGGLRALSEILEKNELLWWETDFVSGPHLRDESPGEVQACSSRSELT